MTQRWNTRRTWLVLMVILSLVLAACGGDGAAPELTDDEGTDTTDTGDDAASGEGEPVTIGVAMKTQVQPRWQFEVDIMQEYADELGDVELVVQWANDDSGQQNSQVENLLSQGVDALIIVPVDDQVASGFVDSAHAEGVPVVSYDIGIQNPEVDFFATRDNVSVGRLQAEGALEFSNGEGNYVLVKGDQANNVAREIVDGWNEVLPEAVDAGDVEIIAEQWHAGWSPEGALSTAENALTSTNNNVAAFVTANDGMAGGVIQALRSEGLDGQVYVSGLDVDTPNAQMIVEGAQTMSVWTKIDDMARAALDVAVALARGEEPQSDTTTEISGGQVPTKLIEVVAITAENMCEFINEIAPEGWMSVDDVYVDEEPPADCQ